MSCDTRVRVSHFNKTVNRTNKVSQPVFLFGATEERPSPSLCLVLSLSSNAADTSLNYLTLKKNVTYVLQEGLQTFTTDVCACTHLRLLLTIVMSPRREW